MRRLRERYPDVLVVLGVHSAKFPSERQTEAIRDALRRHDIRHPVVNDAGFHVWQQYAVRAWPTLALIDPRGRVVGAWSGEIRADDLFPVLDALVARSDAEDLLDRRPLDLHPEGTEEHGALRFPSKVLAPGDGRLFVADTGHHRVLEMRLSEDGRSATVARAFGSGQPALVDGDAASAAFHDPRGLALSDGTLYVADTGNHAIRAIDLASGAVRTVAGTGEKAHGRFAPVEPTATPLRSPWDLLAMEGILFIAMAGSHQVWVLLEEETLGVFAGSGAEALVDGTPVEAGFNQPSGLAFGLGHLLVADAEASAIRAISLDETPRVFTLVGQGLFEFGDVDGTGAGVRLQHPSGVAFHDGRVLIADTYNNKVKRLDPTTGRVETLAGTGAPGDRDGPMTEAELSGPEGLSAAGGILYIADTNNHRIRAADLSGNIVHTVEIIGKEETMREENGNARPAMTHPARSAVQVDVPPESFEPAEPLAPVTVAPGRATLALDLAFPEGMKRSPDAPLTVRDLESGTVFTFEGEDALDVPVDASGDRDIPLDLTVTFCSADGSVCHVYDARLAVPLRVSEGAPNRARVPIPVPPPR